mgnify:CR=1
MFIPINIILSGMMWLFGVGGSAADFETAQNAGNCLYWEQMFPGVPRPANCPARP